MRFRLTSLAAALAVLAPFAAQAEGPARPPIFFAQVAALEGPAADLGLGMKAGIEAAFAEANARGGVNGHWLMLEGIDDGYEPDKSIAGVQKVIDTERYIALIGPVGTPTTKVTQPLASEAHLPFIGPFTGAGFLRDATHGNIFNVRATYDAETEEWMKYLVDQQGLTRIAMLYQDDAFGYVGLEGVQKALTRRGMELIAEGTYERNTTEVDEALATIKASNPEAVVMVGAYGPCAAFIRKAREGGLEATYVNISFVGSKPLARDLGEWGEGVIVSQVVPFPLNSTIQAVADYQSAIITAGMQDRIGFISLEGYLVGRLAIEALDRAGPNPTRETYLHALNELRTVRLGGLDLVFGEGDNQGLDDVFLTILDAEGRFQYLTPAGSM